MCLNPKWIYKKGNYKESNYRGNKGDFYEIGTYSKCGHCEQCIAEKANNWVIRNKYESEANEKKCFITLTYKNNPIILVRKDFQDFMKRLRINLIRSGYKNKIRMFEAGEYGEKSNRPHGHIIIYGWEANDLNYLGINKKENILYKSKLIEKTWGLGRTSYQKFDEHEAPYIALYNTNKEEFKKAYILTRQNIKKLKEHLNKKSILWNKNQRENIYNQLKEYEKQFENEKKKYIAVKEFNSWSIALGWNEFLNNYHENYIFEEYIEEKTFVTPTPWVKKLANLGSENAKAEMFRREEEIKQSQTEEEEAIKNKFLIIERRKKEHKNHHEKDTGIL